MKLICVVEKMLILKNQNLIVPLRARFSKKIGLRYNRTAFENDK